MPTPPTQPAGASGIPWWLAPAIIGVLTIGGFLSWNYLEAPADRPATTPPAAGPIRPLPPQPPDAVQPGRVHWIGHGVESGVKVVYVQAVPGGDILVVNAATGRLIETRPAPRAKK